MGQSLEITYEPDKIFARVSVDIINRSKMFSEDTDLSMTEHDRQWFSVALSNAINATYDLIYHIISKTEPSLLFDDLMIVFNLDCTNERQKNLIPSAIEKYIVDFIVSQWLSERGFQNAISITDSYDNLKHVALLHNGVARKNTF